MTEPEHRRGAVIDGRFQLERRLGAGGYGSVWLAQDGLARGIENKVALKLLHPHLAEVGGESLERFSREAEILKRLDHPNVARPIAFSASPAQPYLAMELVTGVTLDRVIHASIDQNTQLPSAELARIFDELCSPIQYAHSLGIVHRDLKPKNVMVVRRAEKLFVKVLDFGISRLLDNSRTRATTVGRVIGSYFYMAPEQVRGEAVDARADVFALGAILFELVALKRAFSLAGADTPEAIVVRICSGPRPLVSDVREQVSSELDAVVARALAIDPSERFQSVAALLEAALPAIAELRADKTVSVTALRPVRAELDGTSSSSPLAMSGSASGSGGGDISTMLRVAIGLVVAALVIAGVVIGVRWGERSEVVRAVVVEDASAGPPRVDDRFAGAARGDDPSAGVARGDDPSAGVARGGADGPDERSESVTPARDRGALDAGSVRAGARARERAVRADAAVAAPRLLRARALLEAARKGGRDLRAIAALQEELSKRAKELSSGAEQTRLLRLIEERALEADLEGLAGCLEMLERR